MANDATKTHPQSGFYCGLVDHRRYKPRFHGFRYRMAMPFVDVNRLSALCKGRWLWSVNRFNVVNFKTSDYLAQYTGTLVQKIEQVISERGGSWQADDENGHRAFMMAHPRYLGYVMNPIALYFCYEASDLKYVVAEVTNTPWDERHIYLLEVTAPDQGKHAFRTEKEFHVSPFMNQDMDYAWRISNPGEKFGISIRNMRGGELLFDAIMRLKHRPWQSRQLARTIVQFPMMTAQVIAGIYWQALRLYMKKIKYVPHPGERKQRTRLHHEIARSKRAI